jgi:hypothetical protein
MTITSLEFELGPASFNPDSPLPRFSPLPGSLCGSSRFRLRVAGVDRDGPLLELSSLSDSMIMVSFGASATLGVEAEDGVDDVRDRDRDWMDSNKRWASRTGIVKSREDDPVGPVPMLDGGGDVDGWEAPGRAYNSVQCLAVLSCCFLFLTYSVAIEGTKYPGDHKQRVRRPSERLLT